MATTTKLARTVRSEYASGQPFWVVRCDACMVIVNSGHHFTDEQTADRWVRNHDRESHAGAATAATSGQVGAVLRERHPDDGIDLGLRLVWGLHDALFEGDDRELVPAIDELREHTDHLAPENPARAAVSILAQAFGIGRDGIGPIWQEGELRDALAHLTCDLEEVAL